MAKHEPENVGVQDISQNRADTNEDKKDEVEYEECTTSNFEMIVVLSVWEVCKEGRNCTRPHYDCMPCGREMSYSVWPALPLSVRKYEGGIRLVFIALHRKCETEVQPEQ